MLYPPPNPDVVCWQPGVKLRWKDFAARSFPAHLSYPGSARLAACCTAEIAVLPYRDEHDRPTLLVESFFVKSKSWVRDSTRFDNQLVLAHEQLHFDINELFARKIRQKIAQHHAGTRASPGLDLQDEIGLLLKAENVFNQSFDQETHQDPSLPRLQKWQALVARELAALQEYQSTACTCGQ
ncbi:hypothetical protein GCM10023185_00750 [Hymenobacter saemangeumensis]|uniref:DUF922 domain-containing protein n=2 Tax=Hymenobacter saemangeumensis TaxID=1084522 RepID=A0ABP8HWV2_9BACT